DAQTASPAGSVGCGHGTGPTASGPGPGRPRPSGPGRPVSRIFISFPAGDAGWAAIGSVPFLLMPPRPPPRHFRNPAALISIPNVTEPRPPPEVGPTFALAWVPRRSLGCPHVGAGSRDSPGMEPPYHSLPAGRYQLEVVFSRPMDRQSVEETLAQRLGQTLLPHWVWLDDRTARFTVNLARPVIVDFHGAKGRNGVTIWELWTMNLRGRRGGTRTAAVPRCPVRGRGARRRQGPGGGERRQRRGRGPADTRVGRQW